MLDSKPYAGFMAVAGIETGIRFPAAKGGRATPDLLPSARLAIRGEVDPGMDHVGECYREAPGVRPLQHGLDDIGRHKITALKQAQQAPARTLPRFSKRLGATSDRVAALALLLERVPTVNSGRKK